ncbi:hypothetical protein CBM2594_P130013 [Cupriavidus taiwanensis]|uniref:Uncharacterized protein n=1 Tax=Cupriavidus taiwanensis TaxID=164546 RepID=A0A7Z7NPQ4_9BURK|nr:hypothetical protein CBM2594_P130013 [Cupriavidus taiwanensis]
MWFARYAFGLKVRRPQWDTEIC